MKSGIINILKPANMTSHQVVAYVRRTLKMKKVGHTGTLDPNAMGVLPICIGKATRVSEYVMDLTKTYRAEMTFGLKSDTGDLYGEVQTVHVPNFTSQQLDDALKEFIGTITQIPPMASAIKVKGKKLYEYHRKGQEVEIPKREVDIYSLQLVDGFPIENNKAYIDIHCSKGTYVRTLCQDIGKKLDTGALMSYLIRTDVGPFSLDNAVTLDKLTEDNYLDYLRPLDIVLEHIDKVTLEDVYIQKLVNGVSVEVGENLTKETVRVYDLQGNFIAICKNLRGNLKPHKVFN